MPKTYPSFYWLKTRQSRTNQVDVYFPFFFFFLLAYIIPKEVQKAIGFLKVGVICTSKNKEYYD